MGILSSMLSGASYGTELGNMEEGPKPGQDGHFVAAIKIGAFEDVSRFKSRVDGAIRQIHECQLAKGYDRIYTLRNTSRNSTQMDNIACAYL